MDEEEEEELSAPLQHVPSGVVAARVERSGRRWTTRTTSTWTTSTWTTCDMDDVDMGDDGRRRRETTSVGVSARDDGSRDAGRGEEDDKDDKDDEDLLVVGRGDDTGVHSTVPMYVECT